MKQYKKWTQKDEIILRKIYNKYSTKEVAIILNRSITAIHQKVLRLNIQKYQKDYCVDTHKKCSKCKNVKKISEFRKDKTRPDGYQYVCKQCNIPYYKQYHINNKNEICKKNKQYYLANKILINKKAKQYHKKNRNKNNKRTREYYVTHKKETRTTKRKYERYETPLKVEKTYKDRYHYHLKSHFSPNLQIVRPNQQIALLYYIPDSQIID